MVKKILKIIALVLGIGLLLFLVLNNIDSFIHTTNRLKEIFNSTELKNFFQLYNEKSTVILDESIKEITEAVGSVIDSFEQTSKLSFEELLQEFLSNLLDFGFDFFIYFCNYGLNAILISYIMLHETFNGEQLSIKTSPLAHVYLLFNNLILKLKQAIINLFNLILRFLSINKKVIVLSIFLLLCSNGFMYRFIVEFVIFFITYIIRVINLETYLAVLEIVESIFIFVYPKLKLVPTWIWIPTIALVIFMNAVTKAKYKLKKNHQRLKDFAKDELTQTTFINGPPGTGKTLLNVNLTLASEENYIDELNKKLLEYELKFPTVNFAKVRLNPEYYPEHSEYYHLYDFIYNRGSFNISNYSIMSPTFDSRCKIWHYEYMRKNKQQTYPLEEYIVISLSEFDKEYNSHDDKKLVGEDGVHTFFSTVSHELKRHVKIFVDYQLKDQVPLRIRGNAEYFINIKKREKKYPVLLFLYYAPFKLLKKITCYYIEKYEKRKRTISRKTTRKALPIYKRNDMTLPYVILRNIAAFLNKICKWFEQFYYFKLKVILSQEDDLKGIKKNLFINLCDLEHNNEPLYDTTFLSYAYETKCSHNFRNLEVYQGLQPTPEELEKQDSYFLQNSGFTTK